MNTIYHRTKFRLEAHGLKNDVAVARTMFQNAEYLNAFDCYEQLVETYPNAAVALLAELYDCYQRFPHKDRYRLYQSRIFDFGIRPGDKVLDIGSGHIPFPLATHLADKALEDHHYGRAGQAFKHLEGKPVYECDVEKTPFKDKEFDFVYCSHVLEHTHEPERACEELMRIARRGYIETPLKAKDIFLNSAKVSNHTMAVEASGRRLIFTAYTPEEIEGLQCNILMDMHTAPQTQREKAFSALIYLKPHLFNTMFLWKDRFEYEVRPVANDEAMDQKTQDALHRKTGNDALKPHSINVHADREKRSGRLMVPTNQVNSIESVENVSEKGRSVGLKFMQVHTYYPNYLAKYYESNPWMLSAHSDQQIETLIEDGFSGVHIFPPYMGAQGYDARMVIANNPYSQGQWIREKGLKLDDEADWVNQITLAQVEHFRPDVLYLSDPITFDSKFVRSLSYSPKLVLGWRAANIPENTDWSEFDVIMSSLSGLRRMALKIGARSVEHFYPGFPVSIYDKIKQIEPEYDVAFTGQWTLSQHPGRNRFLQHIAEAAAQQTNAFSLAYYLSGQLETLPEAVARHNLGERFGLPMHFALRSGKIAFDARGSLARRSGNSTVDLAADETANMRIFEATGCGAFLLTEHFNNLSQYFEPGSEIETFKNETELIDKIRYYLAHPDERLAIADRGRKRCQEEYAMERRAQDLDRIIRRHLPVKPVQAVSMTDDQGAPDQMSDQMSDLMAKASEALSSNETTRAFKLLIEAKSYKMPRQGLDVLRAVCFMQMNQPVAALQALREELRYFPDNRSAQKMLDQLQVQYPATSSGKIHDPDFRELLEAVRPFSMSSEERLYSLYSLAKRVCQDDIPGDFVECGVAAGGSTALIAAVIKRFSRRSRRLYAFDSFEGMPVPTEEDVHCGVSADDSGWGTGTCAAPEESVRQICERLGVSDIVKTVKGYFENTLPEMKNEIHQIAMMHMDGDWYASTKAILDNLYDRVATNGVIQVDDYGHWEGCKKALHEFEQARGLDFAIRKIDYTGVWFEKPKEQAPAFHRPGAKAKKIVQLCMQDFGGAGKAAYRLHKGLQSIGLKSDMLVLNKKSGDPSVKALPEDYSDNLLECQNVPAYQSPVWQQQVQRWHSALSHYPDRPAGLEMFTDAESSVRLDRIREVQEADVVNLHWVAGAMDYSNAVLALKGKRVVWTLHDMNPFTGGCHYAGGCEKYKTACQKCPQLGSGDVNDLSRQVWTQKHYIHQNLDIDIVAPSQWLGQCASQSALFSHYPVHVIPNGFPLDTFKPYPKSQIRKEFNIPENSIVILFGADSVANHRKGFAYLLQALNRFPLKSGHEYVLATFGSLPQGTEIPSKYRVFSAGQIANEDQLALVYSAADLFVLPSLEDNLPNTVVEAMACGLPVVGFDIGGVPDMVDHRHNGYLAKPKDIADLVKGIDWVTTSCENNVNLTRRCRQKAEAQFALDVQANAYRELYNRLMNRPESHPPVREVA